jgi:hypothetical protein
MVAIARKLSAEFDSSQRAKGDRSTEVFCPNFLSSFFRLEIAKESRRGKPVRSSASLRRSLVLSLLYIPEGCISSIVCQFHFLKDESFQPTDSFQTIPQ